MNSRATATILLIGCLLLGIALFVRHNSAVKETQVHEATILQISNQWAQAKDALSEQKQVNSSLETNLLARAEELKKASNAIAAVSANLAKTEAEKKAAQEQAQAEMAKRDARISELENQRDDLTRRMTELNSSITGLEGKISDTQKKLAASEGDREFLLKELKRLQSEKAELERQFNDLAMLREQVHRLKDELSISRRLDWIRRGLYGSLKGAEKLQKGNTPPTAQTNYNLNVELHQDGAVKVAPPGTTPAPGAKTNAAPAAPVTPAPAPAPK